MKKNSTSNKSSRKLQANISWILIFPEKQNRDHIATDITSNKAQVSSLGMCLYLFPCVRLSLTRSQGVQEEKELANSGADVERVEGLLQPIQLRQCGDQLQDVVLQILHQITTVNFILAFFFLPFQHDCKPSFSTWLKKDFVYRLN